jgi:hypothetical protein
MGEELLDIGERDSCGDHEAQEDKVLVDNDLP